MTSQELAEKLGCSAVWIFELKKKFPDRCPKSFDDVPGWQAVLDYSRIPKIPKKLKAPRSSKVVRVPYVRAATQPRKKLNGELPPSEEQLSDIARLTRARANKVETEHEILTIELAATRRQVVRQEEVVAIFAKLANVLRGRLMKMRNDLPSALLGLDAPAIDKVLAEKMEEAMSDFVLPRDFFDPRGIV